MFRSPTWIASVCGTVCLQLHIRRLPLPLPHACKKAPACSFPTAIKAITPTRQGCHHALLARACIPCPATSHCLLLQSCQILGMPGPGRFLPGSSDCNGAFPLLRRAHLRSGNIARAPSHCPTTWPRCIEAACGEIVL